MAKFGDVKFKYFFDRPEVLKRLADKEVRDLSQIGAYAMRTVRQSMRPGGKAGKSSQPGEPPRYHTKLLRDGVLFAYEPSRHSVVVGPRKLNGRSIQDIPRILNFGGRTRVPEAAAKFKVVGGKRIRTFERTGRMVQKYIEPRPYIGPRARTWDRIIAKWRQITERNKA